MACAYHSGSFECLRFPVSFEVGKFLNLAKHMSESDADKEYLVDMAQEIRITASFFKGLLQDDRIRDILMELSLIFADPLDHEL